MHARHAACNMTAVTIAGRRTTTSARDSIYGVGSKESALTVTSTEIVFPNSYSQKQIAIANCYQLIATQHDELLLVGSHLQ